MTANAEWEEYFDHFVPPSTLQHNQKAVQDFASANRQIGHDLVLITSGGTTVPLENNTVRFVDNFSVGSRGSSSAEHRSLQPFSRHFAKDNFLEYLHLEQDLDGSEKVAVKTEMSPKLLEVLKKYEEVKASGRLLLMVFTTVSDYLFNLRAFAEALHPFGPHAMFYLAAAVSDFYVPSSQMAKHKIRSSNGPLELKLQQTPKLLSPLVKDWATDAFVVSFKLETNKDIIAACAREALDKYKHQVVISNVLATRRKQVTLVTKTEEKMLSLSDHEFHMGIDVEQKIVDELLKHHKVFIQEKQPSRR
ncbi:phosphopantothenate--cysteine ligase-like isoform X2 [Corticium candelabrum]|uniref:phosphopantothenate--cysteine ligase-like isoform X2 n=1 Tax=Corticium candelabrum TaxID=121492 RepID=UPI002E264440|nr:phosphopantothenate--cysteine ligase-like isoform X2 [Corticium candelabrum]